MHSAAAAPPCRASGGRQLSVCPNRTRSESRAPPLSVSQSVSRSVLSDSLRPPVWDLPGSSVPGIFQARLLERVTFSFSRGSSQPRDGTWVSCIAGRFFAI